MLSRAAGRNRLLAIASLSGLMLVAGLLTAGPSQAAFASQITITAVRPVFTIPNTVGDYPLVTTGDPFAVDISTDGWVSTNRDTPLALTVASGPEAGTVLARTTLPARATTATFTGATLTSEALAVGLEAAVDTPDSDVLPGFTVVDVLGDFTAADATAKLLSIGGSTFGVGTPCAVSAALPFCVDMLDGADSPQLLASGVCDPFMGCVNSPTITWLANVSKISRLVLKCHKTLCPGTGVPNFIVRFQLTRDESPRPMLSCPTPRSVMPNGDPCIASGKRFGAGNLELRANWLVDGRVVIGK